MFVSCSCGGFFLGSFESIEPPDRVNSCRGGDSFTPLYTHRRGQIQVFVDLLPMDSSVSLQQWMQQALLDFRPSGACWILSHTLLCFFLFCFRSLPSCIFFALFHADTWGRFLPGKQGYCAPVDSPRSSGMVLIMSQCPVCRIWHPR